MFNTIKNILKAIWNCWVKAVDIYIKIFALPWNLAIKLYHWVYDEV